MFSSKKGAKWKVQVKGTPRLEPHEKRRIAERGKTAADIGYEGR